MEGWIKIYRQIRNHWIWKDKEPFDKRSAWIDLLLSVNHKSKKIPFENDFIEIERGQTLTSIKQLAEKWSWSRHKVSDYLNQLEQDTMIVQVRDTRKTLISIVNYSKYQPALEEKDILGDTLRDRLGT
jgi:DNA replication protein DnaD|nr:MAG TPA: replisome organizer [Caudoviricetes sp.]